MDTKETHVAIAIDDLSRLSGASLPAVTMTDILRTLVAELMYRSAGPFGKLQERTHFAVCGTGHGRDGNGGGSRHGTKLENVKMVYDDV